MSKRAVTMSWQSHSTSEDVWLTHQMIQLINSGWTKDTCVVGGGMGVLCLLAWCCVFIARL